MSERRARLLLLAAGILAGALLGEAALRLALPPVLYVSWRNVLQVACTRPHPDPRLGYVNREGYRGEFANREFRTLVHINSRGLREREVPYERTAGRRRILALGDSYVMGWGVEGEEAVSRQLEARLSGTEVLNAGCSGWSTAQEVAFFELEAHRYAPDLVLLFFVENDPEGNLAPALPGDPPAPGAVARLKRLLARHSALWVLARAAKNSLLPTGDPVDEASLWSREVELIGRLRGLVEGQGGRLAVVYVPLRDERHRPGPGRWHSRLAAWCRASGLPFLDLQGPLQASAEPVFFRIDDHWTAAGHRVAAEATRSFIERERLLPP